MSEHQTDWRQVKIGELLKEHSERSISSNQHEVLSVTKDGIFSQREYFKKQIASENNSGYKVVRRGDVVFSAMNLWMGSIDVIKDQEIGIVSPAYITMRPTEGMVDTGFLGYFLRGDEMRKKYVQHSQQGASIVRRNLNKDDLLDDEVCIPSLPEQKKIAEILSGIDRKHSKLKGRINALSMIRIQLVREFLKQGMRKGTDHTNGLPQGWEERTLGEVSEFRRGSFPQPYGNPEWFDDAGYPFVQVYDINDNGKLKPNTKTRISQAAADKSVFIPSGSLIVSLQGSIGRVAITQYDSYVDRTILIFMNYERILSREYFALLIGDLFSRKSEVADGGIIKTITKQTLKEFAIRIPPLDEQQKLSEIVSTMDHSISHYKEQLCKVNLLKQSLAGDLLSGRKRVSV